MHALQGRVVQSWVKITRVSAKFELRFESLKSISALILFVYKLMIGSSKNSTENYARKCFWIQEKETRVNFNPRLSANRPSNNSAQVCRKNCEVLSLVMLTSILTQILEGGGLILGWIPLCTENKCSLQKQLFLLTPLHWGCFHEDECLLLTDRNCILMM